MIGEDGYLGQPIRSLQRMLRAISAVDASVPLVISDGFFGKQTAEAVRAVQKKQGLPCTGIVNLSTWQAIVALADAAQIEIGQAEPLLILLQESAGPGQENAHLLMVKSMLMAIRRTYPAVPPQNVALPVNDAACTAALRWLQRAGGMEPSGILDKQTWRLLSRLYRLCVQNG